jgi:hypothetical protein
MSLPLPRRIAQAVLLVGAAAAPLVGAGVAQAAALPQAGALGGLTSLDHAPALSGTVHKVAKAAPLDTVKGALPSTSHTLGDAGKKATPVVKHTASKATSGLAHTVADTAQGADTGLPLSSLPLGH